MTCLQGGVIKTLEAMLRFCCGRDFLAGCIRVEPSSPGEHSSGSEQTLLEEATVGEVGGEKVEA